MMTTEPLQIRVHVSPLVCGYPEVGLVLGHRVLVMAHRDDPRCTVLDVVLRRPGRRGSSSRGKRLFGVAIYGKLSTTSLLRPKSATMMQEALTPPEHAWRAAVSQETRDQTRRVRAHSDHPPFFPAVSRPSTLTLCPSLCVRRAWWTFWLAP